MVYNFPLFKKPGSFLCWEDPALGHILNKLFVHSQCNSLKYVLIPSSLQCLGLPSRHLCYGFLTQVLWTVLLSPDACYIKLACPYSWFVVPSNIGWWVQIVLTCFVHPVSWNHVPQHFVLQHPPCSMSCNSKVGLQRNTQRIQLHENFNCLGVS